VAFTYNLATDIGRIRALIRDITEASATFTDEEIQAFLDIEGGVVLHGAALALETIAGNEVLVLKVGQLLDIKTDGAKVADAILAVASRFRRRADAVEDNDWAGFEIAEVVDNSSFAYDEKLYKELLGGLV
jgi:hypothetical protein